MKDIIETLIERGWKNISKNVTIQQLKTLAYGTLCQIVDGTNIIYCFSLADLIDDNEAMRLCFPPKKFKAHECPKCGYWEEYSKHTDRFFCPIDGRKLKEEMIDDLDDEYKYMRHQQQLIIMDSEEEKIKYIKEHMEEK